jgi:hypothetical protein
MAPGAAMRGVTNVHSLSCLSDSELLSATWRLARSERAATVQLLAALAEVDERRLFLGEGCSSLFTYCTRVLRLSEHAAYGRIEAARVARRFPVMLELLEDGALTLTTVCIMAPHLTHENHAVVLEAARHKSKREVELQVAALMMMPDIPTVLRKLPQPRGHASATPESGASRSAGTNGGGDASVVVPTCSADEGAPTAVTAAQSSPAVIEPLTPERYKLQLTVSKGTHDKLRRLQDLLRHQIPSGDPALILDKALTLLLKQVENTKLAAAARPRPLNVGAQRTRRIPASVRRQVWERDDGRCAFVGSHGRCDERGFLEFHHIEPYAAGGATTADNLELRCRAHNQYEAELFFGRGASLARERRALWMDCGNSVRTELVTPRRTPG